MVHLNRQFINDYLAESLHAFEGLASNQSTQDGIISISDVIADAFVNSRKLLIAGNGGSAADAQHMAGEFVSRLFFDHQPLPAIALTTDTSVLTAVGNDYGYEKVFERQVMGLGFPGDIFLGISTSGKSANILRALEAAKQKNLITIGFAGEDPSPMDPVCDYILHVPSSKTAIIQQLHITAVHLICGLVEKKIFGADENDKT